VLKWSLVAHLSPNEGLIMKPIGRLIIVLAILGGSGGCGSSPAQQERPSSAEQSPAKQMPPVAAAASVRHTHEFKKIRGPAVAGIFYPRHEKDLTQQVDQFLAAAKQPPLKNVRALICPHAGYEFSGAVAAIGYKQLVGRDIHTVILLGPSHYAMFEGASLPETDAYETPLGQVPISSKVAELAAIKPFAVHPECKVQRPQWWQQASKEVPPFGEDTPDTWEHSLEVQLPFLQRTLADFNLVPVVYGNVDPESVANALMKVLDDRTLLVASSDLSHYFPYEVAKQLDGISVSAICELEPDLMQQLDAAAAPCGKAPILTLMHIAKNKGWKAKLLDCRNSGDTAGDKSRVVGYAAIAFYDPGDADGSTADPAVAKETAGKETAAEQAAASNGKAEFSPEDRTFLLQLARNSVKAAVEGTEPPKTEGDGLAERLLRYRACFVTLTIDGKLRGCIGSIFPQEPLYQAVIRRAKSAALEDPRFSRVTAEELAKIRVEVSVLTLPRRLPFSTPEELLEKLRPGVDGVVLNVGRYQATFLPQVWEQISEKETFLAELAKKAGLEQTDWRRPDAAVMIYQAEAFKEAE
jgi:MEMO1 family protein